MENAAAPTVRESLEAAITSVDAPEQPIPAQEAPPAQTSEAAPAEAPAQETEAEKAERLRNKDGTFAKGKPEPKVEAKPAEPAKPAAPKARRPDSWKKEMEPHWDALSPEVQGYVGEREKQYQAGVSTYKTEADRAKGIMGALAEFEPALQQAGIPADKWIASMGHAHRTLAMGSPQDKLGMVQQILAQNRIPAQLAVQDAQGQWQLLGQPQPQQQHQPQQPQIRPEEINTLVQKSVQESLANTRAEQEYKAFTEAKDEKGEPKHPHFDAVKATMAGLLQAELAQDYPSAYEAALAMPQHRALREAEQQQQATQQAATTATAKAEQAKRARSQAVSVKSSTPSAMTQATGTKSLRDQLAESFDKVTASRV